MTNTKFRKRALLSSVAMLLVALVALGSATFAWFQANLNVDASGLSIKTATASGLQIASESEIETASATVATFTGWSRSATMSHEGVLQPASWDNTLGAFKSATAGASNISAADATKGVSDGVAVTEWLYFKLEDGTTASGDVYLTGVTFKNKAEDTAAMNIAKAIRIVILDSTGNKLAQYTSQNTTVSSEEYIDDGAIVTSGLSIPTATTTLAAPFKVSDVGTSGNATNAVQVCLYLDGGDSLTTTDNASSYQDTELLKQLKLDFELRNPVAKS